MYTISNYEILPEFIQNNGKCVVEAIIEKSFNKKITDISPNIEVDKTWLGTGITDGVFRFYDDNHNLQFWTLRECKRDVGPSIVNMGRAFLQSMMYLGGILFDYSAILRIDKFKGIFLDSARYFSYIPKSEILKVSESFEPLYNKYYQDASPCNSYYIEDLDDWAVKAIMNMNKYVYRLDDNFRLDIIIRDLYENKI